MEENKIAQTIAKLILQIKALELNVEDFEQKNRIQELKEMLFQFFPEYRKIFQLKGRIEDVIIELNSTFSKRIILPNKTFDVYLNIYVNDANQFSQSDIMQLCDCLRLYFPLSVFKYEVLSSKSIELDQILIIIDLNETII